MDYTSTIRVESQTCPGVAFTLHKPSYGRVLAFDRQNAAFREEARKINQQSSELQENLQAQRKFWFEAQAAKLVEWKAKPDTASDYANREKEISRIEAGLEYERLLELAQHADTDEQRKDIADKLVILPMDKEVFRIDAELLTTMRALRERSDNLVATDYNPARLKWGIASIEGLTINGAPATADSTLQDGPIDLVREIVAKIDEITSMTPEQLRNFEQPSSSEEAAGKAENTTIALAA